MAAVTYGLHRTPDPAPDADADASARAQARRRTTIADLQAWSQLFRPTACFTHLSSAIVRDWWLPYRLPEALPVWINQPASQYATRRTGARVIRSRAIPPSEVVDGLRLATAAETLVTCAIDLSVLDLVIVVDSALHNGDVTVPELAAVAAEHRRGAPRLREALQLADQRSESAQETVLRILHVTCGIPVEPQKEFFWKQRFVARGDLWIVGTNRLHEYDGADHLNVSQQTKDLRRARRLADAGLDRRGYTAADIARAPEEIIREACTALARPFDPRLLMPWMQLWHGSTFSPAGRAALERRLTGPRARRSHLRNQAGKASPEAS
jgi:hypothetical protein